MFPGSVLLVLGVRAKRGRSVGGRGAGPGFMNWSREYMLDLMISGFVARPQDDVHPGL